MQQRTCRVCGCTEQNCQGCVERTGEACFWVATDLCSACDPATRDEIAELKADLVASEAAAGTSTAPSPQRRVATIRLELDDDFGQEPEVRVNASFDPPLTPVTAAFSNALALVRTAVEALTAQSVPSTAEGGELIEVPGRPAAGGHDGGNLIEVAR